MKVIIAAALLFLGSTNIGAQSAPAKDVPKFMGRPVTIVEPKLDENGFPEGPASICVDLVPQRQCYKAPKEYGKSPSATVVLLQKNMPALFFSTETYGVSGWQIHFALLRPSIGKDLEDIFRSDTSVPNQSQHAFWTEPAISDAQLFVTAEYVWGPDEGHYGEHRYIISVYVEQPSSYADTLGYYLQDRYMTTRKYDLDANADVLVSEKQEILTRLTGC